MSKLITTEDNDEIFLKDYQLPSSNNSRIREKSQQVILPESRYQEETGSLGQMKQLGLGQMKQLGFTTRPKKRSDFELPSITQRGGQT